MGDTELRHLFRFKLAPILLQLFIKAKGKSGGKVVSKFVQDKT